MVVRCAPVTVFIAVTLASFMAEPCGSVTVPESDAVFTPCAHNFPGPIINIADKIIHAPTLNLRCMFPPHRTPAGTNLFPLPLAVAALRPPFPRHSRCIWLVLQRPPCFKWKLGDLTLEVNLGRRVAKARFSEPACERDAAGTNH